MFSLRHLKAMVLIVGILTIGFGIIASFQLQEVDANGGRIRQWTTVHTEEVCSRSMTIYWHWTCSFCGFTYHEFDYVDTCKHYDVTTHYFDNGDEVWWTRSRKLVDEFEVIVDSTYGGGCYNPDCGG